MSRFLTDDFINKDPRALLNTSKIATLSDVTAPTSQYIKAETANTLKVTGDCIFAVTGSGVFKTEVALIGTENLDSGTEFVVGKDYSVYICDTGNNNDEIYAISLNTTFPAGYNANNSRKIGGFHYGKNRKTSASMQPVNASGAAYGIGWEGTVYDGIVPLSVWTLQHRPKCSPAGMVYLGGGTWVDIYLNSDNGGGGLSSAYNALPMTGTEGMSWYTFNERALASGKRLISYEEFCKMAYGSPQGLDDSNNNAWTAKTNTGRKQTGFVANSVSSVGCRDAVGNVWEWLSTMVTRAEHAVTAGGGHGTVGGSGAWGWDIPSPLGDVNGNILQYYNQSIVALSGCGGWNNGVKAGCRAVNCIHCPWNVNSDLGVRLACDCL